MSEATTEPVVQTSVDEPTPAETATVEAPAAPEVRDPAALLSAYEAEKAKRREQDKTLKEIREEFNAFKAKAEGKEAEFTAAQEAQRFKDEALDAANQRILKAELRAAATGKVNAEILPDLPALMDLSAVEVTADGEVDQAALAAAINDFITKRPSLAAQGGSRFQGTADGGARTDASKPSQLSQADMARMSPEQIVKADEEGRFDDLRGSR
jgi:hypothetical protein